MITLRNVSAATAAVLALAVQLSACSSKPSSIDSKKTLTSLTTEERRQFCDDHSQYMSSRVSDKDRQKIDCSVAAKSIAGGASAGSDQARSACQEAYSACMDRPVQKTTQASSCDQFPSTADGCPATVGEADDCAEAQADALEKIVKKADDTCKNLGNAPAREEPQSQSQSQKTKACDRLQLMCPRVFDALFAEPVLGTGTSRGQMTPSR